MKVIVFGASKGLGREVIAAGLAAGHQLSAFARNPDRIDITDENLRLIRGNVLDAEAVTKALRNHDAAVCTLGLPTKQALGVRRSKVLSKGTENIVAGMRQQQVTRFICETAIGTGDSAADCTPLARFAFRAVLGYMFREKDRQEALTRASGLDWTIVRPTALTHGPATEQAQIAEHLPAGILTQVSRKDVARWIVGELNSNQWLTKTVTVSYAPRFGDSLRWARHFR